jgi:hypothetical protein
MSLAPGANRNEICLHCRKSANALPCKHPKILTDSRGFRVPKRTASRKAWQKFVDWCNRRGVVVEGPDGLHHTRSLILP